MKIVGDDFPRIETERLMLRQLILSDAPEIHHLRSNPEVNQYLDRKPSGGLADAQAYIEMITAMLQNRQSMYWAVCLKGQNQLIGTVCFWNFDYPTETIEIGYEMLPAYQGKGLMVEAVAAAINFAFKHIEPRQISALTVEANEKSVSLLKRLGFEPDNQSPVHEAASEEGLTVYLLRNKLNEL